jgi:hypothetical protein
MRNLINILSKKEKLFLSILTGWVSLNLILLFIGITQNDYYWGPSNTPYFWPFDEPDIGNSYDLTEFLAYAIVPCIMFFVYIYITKDKIENKETSIIEKESKNKSFGLKQYIILNKKFFIPYFIWAGLQVVFLLSSNCTWEKGMYYPQLFFPFSGYPRYFYSQEKNIWTLLVYTYSYSEFFVYSLLPLVIRYFFLYLSKQRKNLNYGKNS